ncbi:BON domain-containing protein [Asanoa sp. WMMD1127]|uniref:BON domain-containing protein n=1 Tax=Asanoa sp. WMMD1127 TaxID=3016107 RepID=UPI0024178DE9|nr:BON domain-containing protein [Asanoa sp. WMMD1127]MDG4824957.1 BON domain-containing protein [Asanoa sp. WMMD1127]
MIFPFPPPMPGDGWFQRPQGARRPSQDDLLAIAVLNELSADTRLAGGEILVEVQNRVVILDGVVPSTYTRHAAGDAAWRVDGVFDVANRIAVESPHRR